jgi:hypothetical protein
MRLVIASTIAGFDFPAGTRPLALAGLFWRDLNTDTFFNCL